jgi:hypothetical protein
MDKIELLEYLDSILSNIEIHPKCRQEIVEIITKNGAEKIFLTLLVSHLRKLQILKRNATKITSFEKLGGAKDLSSMKFN